MGNTRAVHEGWCDSNAACNCGCDAYEPDFEGIATTLADALRDVTDALGELVVVKGGVTPTIVAPQMNDLTEPFNRARAALGEFDRVSGSLNPAAQIAKAASLAEKYGIPSASEPAGVTGKAEREEK